MTIALARAHAHRRGALGRENTGRAGEDAGRAGPWRPAMRMTVIPDALRARGAFFSPRILVSSSCREGTGGETAAAISHRETERWC